MTNQDHLPWAEKYRIVSFSDVKGQELAIDKVKMFLRNFPSKKALILHGAPGIGKTSLAYATAAEYDIEILEMNASDLRNKEKVSEIIGPASQQRSLFKKGKMIMQIDALQDQPVVAHVACTDKLVAVH